ncbi:MAG: peptide chain release factor N(5)-glutamine methyltransferase [Bacteroidales bacterium]|nr:peptide chain release factor N(5)-glutamine methyltransferase [Bacteroidales bacterium]
MTVSAFISDARRRLEVLYPAEEARAMALRVFTEVTALAEHKYISEPEMELAAESVSKMERMIAELETGRPLQYVLGYTEFAELKIRVSEGVLIPRPETEEMVALAAEEMDAKGKESFNVLDICTGSGCIAWAFASLFPEAQVFGCDISDDALKIACKQRVKTLSGKPVFFWADLLGAPPAGLPKFDLIISNPPYIMEKEKARMCKNVLDFEPSLALFVPDEDPLVFYRRIASWTESLLADDGSIWLEINEQLGKQTAELFPGSEIVQDLSGKDRFVYWSATTKK